MERARPGNNWSGSSPKNANVCLTRCVKCRLKTSRTLQNQLEVLNNRDTTPDKSSLERGPNQRITWTRSVTTKNPSFQELFLTLLRNPKPHNPRPDSYAHLEGRCTVDGQRGFHKRSAALSKDGSTVHLDMRTDRPARK